MSISRSDLASWVGSEFSELLTAAGLTAGNGTDTGDFVNTITLALREMGESSVDDLVDADAAEIYDLVELYALRRILGALAAKVDFSADGASVKLSEQHAMARQMYLDQRLKCEAAYGLSGGPEVVIRSMTLNALNAVEVEYT
jgi:hypothetical protein